MRVQFSVSISEWNLMESKAKEEGYPDVPSFCKDLCLGDRTFQKLWQTVVKKIAIMPKGRKFTLRELVDTPPANLGVKLYDNQEALGIESIGKDNLNTNLFVKL